jgi:hypothetical protein
MKIKDLSVIDNSSLKNLILDHKSRMDYSNEYHSKLHYAQTVHLLEEIQSKLKPLEPIVVDVIDHSFDIGHWSESELKPLELGKMLNREQELKEEIFELHFKEINL